MKRLLLATALPIVFGALYFGALMPADATTVTFTGTYSVSQTDTGAGVPTFTTNGHTDSNGNTSLGNSSGQFTKTLTVGAGYTAPVSFFSIDPTGSSCVWSGCSGGLLTDTINVGFTFTAPTGQQGTATGIGTFQARYYLPYLGCDPAGDHAGKSDCITWGNPDPIVVSFLDGTKLDIMLNNASDWDITPTIQFSLVAGPTVATPEPASLALLGVGILGIAAMRRRTTD